MSTKILVPRASGEGGIGSSDKAWDNGYFNTGHFNEDIYISGVPIAFALDEAGVGGKWEDSATAGNIYYNGGNVGIGTANPSQKLDVHGKFTVNNDGKVTWGNIAGSLHGLLTWDTDKIIMRSSVGHALHLGANNGDNNIVIDPDGNVGIGTPTPGGMLHIEGASATPGIIYNSAAETDVLNLKIGVKTQINGLWEDKEGLSVTNRDGKVGIRTEVPEDQLEIWTKNTDCALSIYNEIDDDKKFGASVYDNGGVLSLLNDNTAIIQIDGRFGTPNFSWFNGGKVAIGKDFAGVTDNPAVPRLEVNATQGSAHPALYVNAQAAYQATFNSTDGRFCQVNWTSDVLNANPDRPNSNFRNGYIALDLGPNGDLTQQYFVIGVADAWVNNSDGFGAYNGIAIRCTASGTNSFVFRPGAVGTKGFFECLGDIQILNGSAIEFHTANTILSAASTGTASGTLYIGNQSITTSSDIRIKKNIEDSKVNALDILGKIRIVDFEWDDPTDTSFNNRNARGRWTGFIAQEAIEHFPTLINAPRKEEDLSIDTESELTWGVDQAAAIPMLIKAVQEQQSIIEELKAEIQALKSN